MAAAVAVITTTTPTTASLPQPFPRHHIHLTPPTPPQLPSSSSSSCHRHHRSTNPNTPPPPPPRQHQHDHLTNPAATSLPTSRHAKITTATITLQPPSPPSTRLHHQREFRTLVPYLLGNLHRHVIHHLEDFVRKECACIYFNFSFAIKLAIVLNIFQQDPSPHGRILLLVSLLDSFHREGLQNFAMTSLCSNNIKESLFLKHGLILRTYSKKSLIMASTFGSKFKYFITMSILPQDKPLTNRPMNDPRDFAELIKAISLPQDVPSTSDRRLIELENQVQRLMEAHRAPKQPIQVNKITSSYQPQPVREIRTQQPEEPEQTLEDKFKDLHLNLSVLEVLAHALMYNAILYKYMESLKLGKNRSEFVQGKVSVKMDDLGIFTLPCRLGDSKPFDTLADLGWCVNIILLYLFKNLNIGLLEETDHVFRSADGTKSYLTRIVKDVEVHIGRLKLLNDFYITDMKKDLETPLLVSRGFLATANVVIDYVYVWSLSPFLEHWFLALGWLLEKIHMTWTHLEKKQTRLQIYTKYLEEPRMQSIETASQYKATAAHTNVHVDLKEEVNELRRQVEILTQRLAQLEPSHKEEDFESDDAFQNPFHRHVHQREPVMRNDRRWEASIKVKILDFSKTLKAEEFIDWLKTVERVFEFKDAPKNRKALAVEKQQTRPGNHTWGSQNKFDRLKQAEHGAKGQEIDVDYRKERGNQLLIENEKRESDDYEDEEEYVIEPSYDEYDKNNEDKFVYGDTDQILVIRKSLLLPMRSLVISFEKTSFTQLILSKIRFNKDNVKVTLVPIKVVGLAKPTKKVLPFVKPLIEKYVDVMPKELPSGLPPMRDI
uniref:Uncharacterized protein n=1 Tax=Tanacetum cinerariifolium TaxID=118510 RepID=A0A699HEL3_TANCI|nr:hypothetical protein [Tanacetum cinerariifolium]